MSEITVRFLDEQAAFFIGADGQPLHFREYDRLLDALRLGRKNSRLMYLQQDLAKFSQEARWCFPTQRSDVRSSGNCVYFITCPSMPDRVKIGMTNNLSNRTRTFHHEYGDEITILAFAKSFNYAQFEDALHAFFHEYRYESSEWFDEAPIRDWLEQFRGAS